MLALVSLFVFALPGLAVAATPYYWNAEDALLDSEADLIGVIRIESVSLGVPEALKRHLSDAAASTQGSFASFSMVRKINGSGDTPDRLSPVHDAIGYMMLGDHYDNKARLPMFSWGIGFDFNPGDLVFVCLQHDTLSVRPDAETDAAFRPGSGLWRPRSGVYSVGIIVHDRDKTLDGLLDMQVVYGAQYDQYLRAKWALWFRVEGEDFMQSRLATKREGGLKLGLTTVGQLVESLRESKKD